MKSTIQVPQMSPFVIIYENRFPIQQRRSDGSWGCRGCGGAIPKGRQTWCSRECVNTYHPAYVISAAKRRDKEICSTCGYDRAAAERKWWQGREAVRRHGGTAEWNEFRKTQPRKIEYDHIIPFSEGGLTVLENIRSLCSECHKRRTKRWHRERKQDATLPLALSSVLERNDSPSVSPGSPKSLIPRAARTKNPTGQTEQL